MILPPTTKAKFDKLKLNIVASALELLGKQRLKDVETALDVIVPILEQQISHNDSLTHKRERSASKMRWLDATFAKSKRLCKHIQSHVFEFIQSGDWIKKGKHVMISGRSSKGKTHLACAIGNNSILLGYRVRFFGYRELLIMLRAADNEGKLEQLIKKLLRIDLIIIDDWTADKLSRQEQAVLFELVEKREKRGSFVITTQFDVDLLHESVGGDTIADAILSRIVTMAYRLELNHDIDFRESEMEIPEGMASASEDGGAA